MTKSKAAREIAVKELSKLERSLTIVIPSEEITQKEAEEFRKLAPNAQLPGFRRGKIPMPVLKKRFEDSVHAEVVRKEIDKAIPEAIKEKDLKPVGGLKLESVEDKKGEPLTFTVLFEVAPEIKLMELSKLKLEKFKSEITDKDVGERLEKMRDQQATWNAVDTPAKEGNRLKIDYEGKIKGEPFTGSSNKDFMLELGKEVMLPGFEKKLAGAKAGDKLKFDATFPKDYGIAEVAKKKANFEVKVHEVQEKELPSLDDNFAKKMDIQEGGLKALKEKIKTAMERELEEAIQGNLRYQIFDELVKKHSLELPKVMIDNEIKNMQEDMKARFAHIMKGASFPGLPREHFEKDAKKKVAIGLIFSELVKKFDLKSTPEDIEKKIETMTTQTGMDKESIMKWLSENEGAKQNLMFASLEDQLIEKILEEAQIKDKAVTYREVVDWKPEEK